MRSGRSILRSSWEKGAACPVLHPCRDFSWISPGGWLLSVSWFTLWFYGFMVGVPV